MPAERNANRWAWWWMTWVITAIIFGVTASAEPKLATARCFVITQAKTLPSCQGAAFGSYLPFVDNNADATQPSQTLFTRLVILPPETDQLACEALDAHASMLENVTVIVRRGGCSFQQKLSTVAAMGASGMIIVNSDDSPLTLGALEADHSNVAVVSIPKSAGDELVSSLYNQPHNADTGALFAQLTSTFTAVQQAQQRVEYFAEVHVPNAAFETYWHSTFSLPLISLEDAITVITSNASGRASSLYSNWPEQLAFFSSSIDVLTRWDFAEEASVHAFSGFAASVLQLEERKMSFKDIQKLESAAHRLIEAGYYLAGRVLLERRLLIALKNNAKTKARELSCHIALARFLDADLQCLEEIPRDCGLIEPKLSATVPSIEVAERVLQRLGSFPAEESDRVCFRLMVGSQSSIESKSPEACCSRDTNNGRMRFQSRFIAELHEALIVMSVFSDESGAFKASLRFLQLADRLCSDGASLKYRMATAVPVIFDSEDTMEQFFMRDLPARIDNLKQDKSSGLVEHTVSALGEVTGSTGSSILSQWSLPEEATLFRYTITPSTMLIGYQGYNVLSIQRKLYELRQSLFPSLSSVYKKPTPNLETESSRKRIGFISSWFRSHSVGKLMLGVIERLDRSQFEVIIYRGIHFLRDRDEMTRRFQLAADVYVELPTDQKSALEKLLHDSLDVAVFPELGMDAWTVFLSHHRVSPIQAVFWGHPITTGNPNIDFSISSRYFATASEDQPVVNDFRILEQMPRNTTSSEQLVLFKGLSTIFTKPADLSERRKASSESDQISREKLHLPQNRHIYICPQTLMKFNPRFDTVLAGILTQDPKALIVLLASDTQKVWTEQLRRRFRLRLGENANRIRFVPTLPYDQFMALLSLSDVMLDPFPFGGGVTTLDALSLGIPVVTLPSAQTVVQLAAGFLRFINVTEGIVASVDEYVSFAVDVATDKSKQERIQTQLLAKRDAIYEDGSAVDDWNTFLAAAASGRLQPRQQ